jgi:hypothetical protein
LYMYFEAGKPVVTSDFDEGVPQVVTCYRLISLTGVSLREARVKAHIVLAWSRVLLIVCVSRS